MTFGLLVLAHPWRVAAELPRLAVDPGSVRITAAAEPLSLWAARLLRPAPP